MSIAKGPSKKRTLTVAHVRRTPHPVIVTRRDNKDDIRVLLYSYYTTIAGWGVLLKLMWLWVKLRGSPTLVRAS